MDETGLKIAGQKLERTSRIDRPAGEIRSADQSNRTPKAKTLDDGIEQILCAAAMIENPQHQHCDSTVRRWRPRR